MSNFAIYRNQVKELDGSVPESEIYRKWIMLEVNPKWNVQCEPIVGIDGKYHFLYISIREDGFIYVGKHSTYDLNDNYHGSGIDIAGSIMVGHTFKTTPLAFFLDSDSTFAAEKFLVNERFINEPEGKTLNNVIGGKSSRVTISQSSGSDMKSVAPNNRQKVAYKTFEYLGLKPGCELSLIWGKPLKCFVVDNINKVRYDGKTYTLTALTKKLVKDFKKNPLYYWQYYGTLLADLPICN